MEKFGPMIRQVRRGGRNIGDFNHEELARLLSKGKLSTSDEVRSETGQWLALGDYMRTHAPTAPRQPAASAASAGPTKPTYYLLQRGSRHGPFDQAKLEAMARSGLLDASCAAVPADGNGGAIPIGDLVSLPSTPPPPPAIPLNSASTAPIVPNFLPPAGKTNFELISLTTFPSIPAAWSSLLRGEGERGMVLASEDYYVVFEHRPLTFAQVAEFMTNKTLTQIPLEYLYAASVFYRKSRNPHGPSARPILAFSLEYTEFTCAMRRRGFWDSLTNAPAEPAEVYYCLFQPNARINMDKLPNNFTDESAKEFLLEGICERLGLEREDFHDIGPVTLGPDHPAIA